MWKKIKSRISKCFVRYFGNIQIRSRPMFLVLGASGYKINGDAQREILSILNPGDVLLRRWDYYISNWFIPGYWSHAGIYAGDNTVIHATPSGGVHEEDILSFLRADSISILRIPNYTDEKSKVVIDRARSLIGRSYDYAFEGKDDDRFFCFEVVSFAMLEIEGVDLERKNTILGKDILESGLEEIYKNKS